MSLNRVEKDLIDQIKLSPLEAKIFLHVTTKGKMSVDKIAKDLGVSYDEAIDTAKRLVERGGFIDISPTEFEAMHPRFTAVNMYRKMCQKENIEFKKNLIVDNIGVALEDFYDKARTRTK